MVLLALMRGQAPSFHLSFKARRLHPLPPYHRNRLLNVTESVTNCQTSAAFGMAPKSGYSLVRRRGGEIFGERIAEWSPQVFMTNDLISLNLMCSSLHLLVKGV